MFPSTIENCLAILTISKCLRQRGFQTQDERECGPVFCAISIEANSRPNEVSRQQ
jgi:hypothetical protein